jgi:hypothetical protein
MIGVDVIEPDSGLTKADLTLAGFAHLDLMPGKGFGTTGSFETNRVRHDLPLGFLRRESCS